MKSRRPGAGWLLCTGMKGGSIKCRWVGAAGLLPILAGFLLIASAQSGLRPLPPVLRTLSDEIGVLAVQEGLQLSRSIEEIHELTGVRVIMAIVESTAPEAIEDYGDRLAQRWRRERGIDVARTIFVVVAIDDRTMQVMPGAGFPPVERALGNPELTSDLPELFRNGQYFEALMRLSTRLRAIAEEGVRGQLPRT